MIIRMPAENCLNSPDYPNEPMTFTFQVQSAKPEQSYYIEKVGVTKLSLPWLVKSDCVEHGEKAFVPRGNCSVTPLVNGSRAFGELEAAIRGATKSIDYITWGFDPAMRFTDGGQTIGEILLAKAETVTIRLMVWYAGYFWSMAYGKADSGKTERNQDHATANLPGYDGNPGEKSKYVTAAEWYKKIKGHPRIEFVGRPMNSTDVGDAISQNPNLEKPDLLHEQGMTKFATHHQKMVLVDYTLPDRAKGFVLGSNTLPRYWDTDDHPLRHPNRGMSYVSTSYQDLQRESSDLHTPVRRRQQKHETVYFQPWQDISARVRGAVLFDLNVNFARAWARAGGGALETRRELIKPDDFACDEGYPAQILRTQPQENDRTICDAYFQNVKNARSYIYFENQYFRLPELTREIAKAAKALRSGGRQESLYLFVVTNVPDDHGRLTTFEMLSALGKTEQMPRMEKEEKIRDKAPQPVDGVEGGDQAGLQSIICTLTASEGKKYLPIYTHSKLMIIDDHYYTLGSANLNRRSMASDSEINVSVPDPSGAKGLREKLWRDHRQTAPLDSVKQEFKKWKKTAVKNLRFYQDETESLDGCLTQFMDRNNPVGTAYD